MKKIKLTMKGTKPILFHNPVTADPISRASKEIKQITSKRSKTDADLGQLRKLEWIHALYCNEKNEIIIPSIMLEASFVSGAKKFKLGQKAKIAISIDTDPVLDFEDKTKNLEELFEDPKYKLTGPVVVNRAKIIKTRPKFSEWKVSFDLEYDENQLNKDQVIEIFQKAGQECGIGDWRPKFGRFEVVES